MKDEEYLAAIAAIEAREGVVFPRALIDVLCDDEFEHGFIVDGCPQHLQCATKQNKRWHYNRRTYAEGIDAPIRIRRLTPEQLAQETDIVPRLAPADAAPNEVGWLWSFMAENQGCAYWLAYYETRDDADPPIYMSYSDLVLEDYVNAEAREAAGEVIPLQTDSRAMGRICLWSAAVSKQVRLY